MTGCDVDVVLYFYDELEAEDRVRAAAHIRQCASCRQRLEELQAIRSALAERPAIEAPPAGDWSGFMRRLDAAVEPSPFPRRLTLRHVAALAAMVALVTMAVFGAARYRAGTVVPQTVVNTAVPANPAVNTAASAKPAAAATALNQSLREGSVEHLERSKLVVLGLTARDPEQTSAADWQYERRLAGSLLSDTRLYRMAAQDRGVTDLARVMRDLETVLLEASLSDSADREALQRVQRLIAKRDLVMKMQVIATSGSAGL